MKIPSTTFLTFSLFSQSSATLESKKVPPRNPTDRIKTLNRFTQSWLTKIIAIKYVRPIRAHRMSQTFTRHVEKLLTAYQRCGFYDTDLPIGGPKPNGKNSNVSWKDFISERMEIDHATAKRSWISADIFDENSDAFDAYETNLSNGLAIRNADAELERLLNTNYEPAEAWKKITTGYIKWIYRYLGECNNYQNHIDRFTKVNMRLNDAFYYLENLSG